MNEDHDSTCPDEASLPDRPAVRWERLVREQRDSGLSVKAFCTQHSLTASSLFAWRRKLKRPPTEFQSESPAAFAAVKIAGKSSEADAAVDIPDSGIALCLSRGRRLLLRRGFDRRLLLDLLELLDDCRGQS